MLAIHLLQYRNNEHIDFPTPEELQARMSVPIEQVIVSLQRLLKEGMLRIEEEVDAQSGVRFERYNVFPLFQKLAKAISYEEMNSNSQAQVSVTGEEPAKPNLFSVFEQEFARPISPMEFETISGWIDVDHYPEELILLALKEAVFAGKVHFKYIDRILLEWNRNRIFTTEQAREYAQRFRGHRS